MNNIQISVTEDYEKLVPFFIKNGLEFSGDEPVPTDLVKCWQIVKSGDADETEDELVGGLVLAKRQGEFIIDGIAIAPEYRDFQYGSILLNQGIMETLKQGGRRIFLVARAPGFFKKQGFVRVPKEDAPNFFECLTCSQYQKTCYPEVMKRDLL